MSLHTLLEAAEFLELSSGKNPRENSNTRAQHAGNFQTDRRRVVSESEVLDRRRRPGGAGTRETHNKLEKNRRAHLKECFDILKHEVPTLEDKKTSNLNILRSALKHIQVLKKQERDYLTESDLLKISQRTMLERVELLRTSLVADKNLPPHLKDLPCLNKLDDKKTATTTETLSLPVSVATQTPPSPTKTEDSKSSFAITNGKVLPSSNDSGLEGSISPSEIKAGVQEIENGDDDLDDEKTDTDEGLSPSDDERDDFEIDVVGSDDVKYDVPAKDKNVDEKLESMTTKSLPETLTRGWSSTPYCDVPSRKRSQPEERREEDSDHESESKENLSRRKADIQACARIS